MGKKTPEEIEELKRQSQALKAEKERKKAEKQAKYGVANAEQNLPVCEIRIPWCWADEPSNGLIAGKDIDIDQPLVQDWIESQERLWRQDFAISQSGYEPSKIYYGPCKRKIIRG